VRVHQDPAVFRPTKLVRRGETIEKLCRRQCDHSILQDPSAVLEDIILVGREEYMATCLDSGFHQFAVRAFRHPVQWTQTWQLTGQCRINRLVA
jgi:hypothetical protein